MSAATGEPLREREYRLRRDAARLRRDLLREADPPLAELRAVEEELAAVERERAQAEGPRGVVADNSADDGLLGPETTKLEVRIQLGMEHVPTAIAHLLTAEAMPLVSCTVRNVGAVTRRLRVTSFLDGYSAPAVDTVELEAQQQHTFSQLPVLRPAAAREVTELTRAALNVLVEDLDRGASPVELHRSVPVWLLARTSAPLAVQDPRTGTWRDATPFYGAFVTPNAPAVLAFLRTAADCHPEKRLVGYQGDAESQVAAVFAALAGLTYVDSVLTASPEEGFPDQRVRLPRESLADRTANCLDATVLYASLLEAASLSPAITVVPGHAFLSWETADGSAEWRHLETTMTATHTFEQACAAAARTAAHYAGAGGLRLWPVRELRSKLRITPME